MTITISFSSFKTVPNFAPRFKFDPTCTFVVVGVTAMLRLVKDTLEASFNDMMSDLKSDEKPVGSIAVTAAHSGEKPDRSFMLVISTSEKRGTEGLMVILFPLVSHPVLDVVNIMVRA